MNEPHNQSVQKNMFDIKHKSAFKHPRPTHHPESTLSGVLHSRISLEDKLNKILASQAISEAQKIQWATKLLNSGVDPKTRHHLVLRWAADQGALSLLELAYEKGAKVEALKNDALIQAVLKNHTHIVVFLLQKGADVQAKQNCALRMACSLGYTAMVRILVEAGANIHAKNQEAIRKAFDGQHHAVLHFLFETYSKAILNKALVKKDGQLFEIAWAHALETKNDALITRLKTYPYERKSKTRSMC